MTFAHRLKLYGFGFLIGVLILSIILKGKKCSSPNQLKMEELKLQYMVFSDKAKCQLTCLGLTEQAFKTELNKCRVNYDMTDIQAKPCGKYFVEGIKKQELKFSVLFEDCDTLSKVIELNISNKDQACDCK